MERMFYGYSSLISLPDISYLNTSNVTNMSEMFKECSSLQYLGEKLNWNTSKVNEMEYMFDTNMNAVDLDKLTVVMRCKVCGKIFRVPYKYIDNIKSQIKFRFFIKCYQIYNYIFLKFIHLNIR